MRTFAQKQSGPRQTTDAETSVAPPVVHDVLKSAGEPLDATARAFMEPRFGFDFSRVRVHADAKAAESARAVNALAYTVGEHVVFAAGRYAPGQASGRSLLAHELAHVVQQSGGPVALQRQPDDREKLANDLQSMSDELRGIGKQVEAAAANLDNLELARLGHVLSQRPLPRAGTQVDKNTVAFFIEAAIETSRRLRPYLAGKLFLSSVDRNKVSIYDHPGQLEQKGKELDKDKSVTPHTGVAPKKRTYGFYHRKTDSIHLPRDATFGHALHEGIHKYSSPALQNTLGIFFNEGVTQIFTDDVLAEHTLGSSSHDYGDNIRCAKVVLRWLNNDKAKLGRAFFHGGAAADEVVDVVDRRLGINNVAERFRLVGDRKGLGLCERIEKVTP